MGQICGMLFSFREPQNLFQLENSLLSRSIQEQVRVFRNGSRINECLFDRAEWLANSQIGQGITVKIGKNAVMSTWRKSVYLVCSLPIRAIRRQLGAA
jgi:hypothetical protein